MKVVRRDARLFLAASAQLLADGFRVRFRAGGASMRPAINDGDALVLEPVGPAAVQPGDVLLYRKHHRGIAHRVVHVRRKDEAVVAFLLRGDAEPACDEPVAPSEVLARIVAVERGSAVEFPAPGAPSPDRTMAACTVVVLTADPRRPGL